jgi:hypothetical protein
MKRGCWQLTANRLTLQEKSISTKSLNMLALDLSSSNISSSINTVKKPFFIQPDKRLKAKPGSPINFGAS